MALHKFIKKRIQGASGEELKGNNHRHRCVSIIKCRTGTGWIRALFSLSLPRHAPHGCTYNLRARGTQITVGRVVDEEGAVSMRTGSGHLSSKVMYCRFYAFMQFLRFRQHEKANAGTAKRCVKRGRVCVGVYVCVAVGACVRLGCAAVLQR